MGDGSASDGVLKVPSAGYLDVNLFEKKENNIVKKVPDSELMTILSEHGIQYDT